VYGVELLQGRGFRGARHIAIAVRYCDVLGVMFHGQFETAVLVGDGAREGDIAVPTVVRVGS
jgi:hypothetical protein